MSEKSPMADRFDKLYKLSQEVDRPSNLPPEPKPEPLPPKPHRGVRPPMPKPPRVEAPAVPGKVIYWTTRARADQLRSLKHLIANLRLKDDERTMTELTIEALDLLLEKYKDG